MENSTKAFVKQFWTLRILKNKKDQRPVCNYPKRVESLKSYVNRLNEENF